MKLTRQHCEIRICIMNMFSLTYLPKWEMKRRPVINLLNRLRRYYGLFYVTIAELEQALSGRGLYIMQTVN